MDEIFSEINSALEQESLIRDEIKEISRKIDPVVRNIQRFTAQIHSDHKNGIIIIYNISINIYLYLL